MEPRRHGAEIERLEQPPTREEEPMKLIMESFREYLLTEAAKGIEDLPKDIYVTIRDDGDATSVYYSDYLGRQSGAPKGYVEIKKWDAEPCLGAYMVIGSLATHGWGPMLYDVAMEVTGDAGLMADRQSLSKDAFSVWQHYMTRGDVQQKQLDDPGNTLTPDGEDNCEMDTAIQRSGLTTKDMFSGEWNDEKTAELLKNSPLMKVYTKGEGTIDKLETTGRLIRR
jgi:hypothetical protein